MVDEVSLLTDNELRDKLRSFNLPNGPIIPTTRKMFEIKLRRALHLNTDVVTVDQNSGGGNNISSSSESSQESKKDNALSGFYGEDKAKPARSFYGVSLQVEQDSATSSENALVFTDKKEALLFVKKNCGARFKSFSDRDAAEAFAFGKNVSPRLMSPVLPRKPEDPIANYKAPKPVEIVRFRRHIEQGGMESLKKLIYENPKYLISSGDTPVILQEGSRYNAMHVAAKAGHKDICKLMIDTLESNDFWKLLYPGVEENLRDQHVNTRRKMFVLDLYINTPDKGGCETPLHFACKFGKVDVVEYLLSCPAVDKGLLNKYGETPQQVICSRVPHCPEEIRVKMHKLFKKEDTFYVPVLRSGDNCFSPKIGKPWSPCLAVKPEESPQESKFKISAYAGPMTEQKAEKFCCTLKSPRASPEEKAKFRNIKRSDSEKGLERVARKLARSQNVPWCEYWKFLGCFTDLTSKEGLLKLESYLQTMKEAYTSKADQQLDDTPTRQLPGEDDVFERDLGTSQSKFKDRKHCGTPTGRNPNIKSIRNRLRWEEQPSDNHQILKDDDSAKNPNQTANNNLAKDEPDHIAPPGVREEEERRAIGLQEQHVDLSNSSMLEPNNFKESLNISNCSEDSLSGLTLQFGRLRLDEMPGPNNDEKPANGRIPESSSEVTSGTSSSEDVQLFLEGFQPSKVDLDVLRCIKSTKIDSDVFPNIVQWRHMVRSFSKATRQAWPGPGSPRYYERRKRISKTLSC